MNELLTQQEQKMLDNAVAQLARNAVVQLARNGASDRVDTSVHGALRDAITIVQRLQERHEKLIRCTGVDAHNMSEVYFWLSGMVTGSVVGLPINQNHLDSMFRARAVVCERAGE